MFRFLSRRRTPEPTPENEPSIHEVLLFARPSDVLWRWARSKYLNEVLPDLALLGDVSQLPAHKDNALIHTLKVIDAIEPTPIRRWAAMLHDIGKGPTFIETPEGRSRFFEHDRFGAEMAPEIMEAASADPELIDPVRRLVSLHMRPISYSSEWTDGAVRRLREDTEETRGEAGWHDLIALSRADLRGYMPEPIDRGLWVLDSLEAHAWRLDEESKREAEARAREPHSHLDGNQILGLSDRAAGAWIGELKNYLQAQVEAGQLEQEDVVGAEEMAREWLAVNHEPDGPQ
ncbi:MAG: HDIG domain-containing metalloprotein [Chloroflexia bacterium]